MKDYDLSKISERIRALENGRLITRPGGPLITGVSSETIELVVRSDGWVLVPMKRTVYKWVCGYIDGGPFITNCYYATKVEVDRDIQPDWCMRLDATGKEEET